MPTKVRPYLSPEIWEEYNSVRKAGEDWEDAAHRIFTEWNQHRSQSTKNGQGQTSPQGKGDGANYPASQKGAKQ